tara:strand:- start:1250 stop:2353 length:1104 start_codon:yes stop_codon:yes gene_type:complete
MESRYKSPNVVCSGCGNNEFLSPPLALGTVLCVNCFTNTEYKTGKKVFSSYPHPTNPYNYSEDELFLVLCFGGLIALYAADQKNHISKVYGWLKGENEDFFEGGIGLDDEETQKLHNRLLEGDDKGIEIAKNLSLDEKSNLFNLLFGMLIDQKDATIEEAAALIKICEITDSNWTSFAQYVTENTPFKMEDLGPIVGNIKLPLKKFEKDGDNFIMKDFNSEDFGQNDVDVDIKTEEKKEAKQSTVNDSKIKKKKKKKKKKKAPAPRATGGAQYDDKGNVVLRITPGPKKSTVNTKISFLDDIKEFHEKRLEKRLAEIRQMAKVLGVSDDEAEKFLQERELEKNDSGGCMGVLAVFFIPLLLYGLIIS